jgi:hypothetical protein
MSKETKDKDAAPAVQENRALSGDLMSSTAGTPAPSTPAPAVEPEAEPKSKRVQASKSDVKGTPAKGNVNAKNDAQLSGVRSGRKRVQDPTEPVTDLNGETPVHPPDLADGPHGSGAWPKSSVRSEPMDISGMSDEMALDQISREIYANVLYRWREDERASKSTRANIVQAIEGRLLAVQGPPIPR